MFCRFTSGTGSDHQYQDILKKVELSLVPNDLCQSQLRKTRLGNHFRLHESFICAGGVKGADVCHVSKIIFIIFFNNIILLYIT